MRSFTALLHARAAAHARSALTLLTLLTPLTLLTLLTLSAPLALTGCAEAEMGDDVGDDAGDDLALSAPGEDGKATFAPALDADAKEDSVGGLKGLPTSVDASDTAVWEVTARWSDTHTPAARAPGIAWGADSGLDWDEKYALWVASMPRRSAQNYGDTFTLTTPFGKELPAPSLECAETALFLRATFASWYGLPFFVEAIDARGERLFLGHFGFRTPTGRYASSPTFKTKYRDHSPLAATWREAGWPQDPTLRARALGGGLDDDQPALFEGAHTGAYLDELFLNKRVGYFMVYLLSYFGSVNLADPSNTFNITPEAIRAGDPLLHRWQRRGIGHTMVVKQVSVIEGEGLEVELISGSMPRRQPDWESASASKYSLTAEKGGGGDVSYYESVPYARLGGGMKRWRVAQVQGGAWTNAVPERDRAAFIPANDYERIAARVSRFAELLVEVSPERKREAILDRVLASREHLRSYPASCAAREKREEAFADLYALESQEQGSAREEVDAAYRRVEDYVFAPLSYTESKTCCWNSTTRQMYQVIMSYAHLEIEAQGEACVSPTVFKSHEDGYKRWQIHAASLELSSEWREWSEDEPCAQRDAREDVTAASWGGVKWPSQLCALTGED